MKICPNCGRECTDNFKFCFVCGYQFPEDESNVNQNQNSGTEQTGNQYQQSYNSGTEQAGNQYQQSYNSRQTMASPYTQSYNSTKTRPDPVSGMAVASLVLGLVSLFGGFSIWLAIFAIIFGCVGIAQCGSGYAGKGMAIAGLVLGIIGLIAGIVAAVSLVGMVTYGLSSLF